MSDKRRVQIAKNTLKAMGAEPQARIAVANTFLLLRSKYPNIGEQRFQEIQRAYGFEYYMDRLAEAYASALTETELEQLAAFYNSPLGRKLKGDALIIEQRRMANRWADILEAECYEATKGKNTWTERRQ